MKQISIPEAVKQMLAIVAQLCHTYPHKRFTLDGRLVGDIGEILVEEAYELKLLEGLQHHHDAVCSTGRSVQIKATMKSHVTFPCDHTPDYYIAVKINADGSFVEIFNGPGTIARRAVTNRTRTKTNLYSVSIAALRKLQDAVEPSDRIALRPNNSFKPTPLRGAA